METIREVQSETKLRVPTTAAYYAMFTAFGITFAVLGPTLPGLAEQTGSGLQAISFLFVARSGGSLLGSLMSGSLYDRLPGHRVLAAFMAMMALTLFLTPAPSMLLVLTLVTFLLGLAQGGINVGGNAMLVWVHGRNSAPYMGGLHFFFGIGTSVAPIIVAWAIQGGGFHWAYAAIAVLMLLSALPLLTLPSPRLERTASPKQAENSEPLLLAGLVTLFLLCYSGAANCFGGWIYTYALRTGIANETTAAYLTSLFWGGLTLGRLAAIPLSMSFRPAHLLWADLAGSFISLGLILGLPSVPAAVWVGSAGLGLSLASMFPVTVSMAGRVMSITGRITGWFSAGANLGALLLPLLVGQFFDTVGPHVLMIVLLVDMAVAVVTMIFMQQRMQQEANN